MDLECVLLLFDTQHPCWTLEMAKLQDITPDKMKTLCHRGLLLKEDNVWCLSPEGIEEFKRVAQESSLPLLPGYPAKNKRLEAKRSRLQMLLDKRHQQRWGLKEYCKPFCFEVPDLTTDELFSIEEGVLSWKYLENNVFRSVKRDFPVTGLAARKLPLPDPKRIECWINKEIPIRRFMEVDVFYKSRYDFLAYAHLPQQPCDPCRMLDTDHFFCVFPPLSSHPSSSELLRILGEFHMFLTLMRHLYMPGYVDLDSLFQDGINWLIYTYDTEEEAIACRDFLAPWAESLVGPASPFEVWSLSFQALQEYGEVGETIHDLLPFVAHPIWRVP